jgi:trans-2,3-dihydro-3-hydroxyanthranilate isomerase
MALRFILTDVFTEEPFGGNQLAVFPETGDAEASLLQGVARELNLTETAFVYPSSRPGCFARLRIFTPRAEIPFAGHPVVGVPFALEAEGRIPPQAGELVFDLESGPVPVTLTRDGRGRLRSVTMTQRRPSFLGQYHKCDTVAQALGLDPADLAITGLPCEVVSTGLPCHIVPVGSLEAMARIQVRPDKLAEIGKVLGFGDLFVFTLDTADPTATVHCRMFAPSFGIPEDPATGSASGCLGAYLVKNRAVPVAQLTRIVCEQGLEMGRPSRILVEVERAGETIVAVRVGGSAVVVGEGTLRAPAAATAISAAPPLR